jgi:hypothetical protein
VKSTAPDAPPKADFSGVQSRVSFDCRRGHDLHVAAGDHLSKIAKHFYGSVNAWKRIFDANRGQWTDPDRIQPGQTLKIPAQS